MAILVNADYTLVSGFSGRQVTAEIGSKKQKVYFILSCDDLSFEESVKLARTNSNILAVNYQGLNSSISAEIGVDLSDVYVVRVVDFGNNISEQDISSLNDETPDGMMTVINVPSDFSSIQFAWQMCQKYEKIRFGGGNLFAVDGLRLGRVGVDILNDANVKFSMECYMSNGVLDVLDVYDSDNVSLIAGAKAEPKTKVKKTVKKASIGVSKPKAKSGKTAMFSDLLGVKDMVMP